MISEDICKEFRKGNKKAFDQIYTAYSGAMYGICLRYTRCPDDAQEVLQESFIKIYKNANQYSLDKPLAAWIKTIVINTALTYIKKNYRFSLQEDDHYFDETVELELEAENQETLKRMLLTFLNKLPDGYRTVFNLFVIENLTHKEIAEHLGISENTSKTQFFKAKKQIQQWVAEANLKSLTA